jgi:hypothetical protein
MSMPKREVFEGYLGFAFTGPSHDLYSSFCNAYPVLGARLVTLLATVLICFA